MMIAPLRSVDRIVYEFTFNGIKALKNSNALSVIEAIIDGSIYKGMLLRLIKTSHA
jgi:hypothetical protein